MKILVLTEGGRNIGFGHIVRCLSLCQAMAGRGHEVDLTINGDETVASVTGDFPYSLRDWLRDVNALLPVISRWDLIILDSYLADAGFLRVLAQYGRKLAFLDDTNRLEYPRGFVINWSLGAYEAGYREKEGVTYLLGSKYISLRKPFWNAPEKVVQSEVKSVFISAGGDDSKNMTPSWLVLLAAAYPDMEKLAALGAAFSNVEAISALADDNTRLLHAPSAEGMMRAMQKADLAICTGGQIVYELARMGVPAVVVTVAENQRLNAAAWEKTGFIEYAGFWSDPGLHSSVAQRIKRLMNVERRREAAAIGKKLVPPDGVENLLNCLTQ